MKISLPFILSVAALPSLHADTPIQLSLTPEIALYPPTTTVRGLSLNIWGENPQTSLNIGLVNGSTGDSGGFSVGIVNYAQSYAGVQWGAVNVSMENFIGWQHGWVNIAQGNFTGFQWGVVNVAENTTGFQLGAVNYAQSLHGLQIGFINVAMNNPMFDEFPDKLATGFPILNWSF
ncbi:MAG: hypothetical protein ABSH48_24215 [Verrucomicrobiota bacterium]|jgi:hypothetical protein